MLIKASHPKTDIPSTAACHPEARFLRCFEGSPSLYCVLSNLFVCIWRSLKAAQKARFGMTSCTVQRTRFGMTSCARMTVILLILLTSPNVFAAEKLSVILDWLLNPDHAPLFVAQEKGYFKQQNLDVELIGPADPTDPPKLVSAGKADIAITYEPQIMQQVDQGLPLIRIGSLIDHPLDCLAVLNTGPIQSIKDLKDKKIGQSTGEVNGIMLKTMLENNGLKLSDVELINVHYDLSQALLSKKVDAITGIMRNFEVIQMELTHTPVRTFFPEKNGVPPYEELIFVVNKNKADDPRWNKFLSAVKAGELYLEKHPDEMWQAFAKAHPELNDELNHRAWLASLPYFSKNPSAINQKEWINFANFMQRNGLIKTALPINSYSIISKQ